MPSDPRVARALDAFAPSLERYRETLASTLEDVRGHLARGRAGTEARARRLGEQLGPFAGGRIDAGRLAAVLTDPHALDASALERLERVSAVLAELVAHGNSLFMLAVQPGADLAACVSARLAGIGRAFAAARIAAAACRGGQASGLDEGRALDAFPFAAWSAAERRLAPPLVVAVQGTDFTPAGLASFLDGEQKLVLIVEGASAPAGLVRLITPGVLVLQAHDPADLDRVGRWAGAGVAALVEPPAPRFVHDPAGGAHPWQRLVLQEVPDEPAAPVGPFTLAQQAEELRQLQALATPSALPADTPAVERAPAAPLDEGDPAERLAAWLVQHAIVPVTTPGGAR
jgi:hypothetical protein